MLLTTMTELEINNQVQSEFKKLRETTVERLALEYDQERKKLKINKASTYAKEYHVKTKGKNTWVICIAKMLAIEKYENTGHSSASCAIHYHTHKGIQVLMPLPDGRAVVINPHFLKRYNERLKLNLDKTLDVIVHFLKNSSEVYQMMLPKEDKTGVIGYCKSGILLGEMHFNNNWLVWKTFVSRDLARKHQQIREIAMIKHQIDEMTRQMHTPSFNLMKAKNTLAKIKEIMGWDGQL
jgi:hypothetical protein